MKRKLVHLIIFCVLLAVFASCDKNLVFEKNLAIPENGWNKDSVMVFNVPST